MKENNDSPIAKDSAAYLHMTALNDPKALFNLDMTINAFDFSDAAVEFLQEKIDRSSPDFFTSWDIMDAVDAMLDEVKQRQKFIIRSHESMRQDFITKPGDVFVIITTPGILSDRIDIRVENLTTGEDFRLRMRNQTRSWTTLKQIDEMGARRVLVEREGVRIPFKLSKPYLARFE